MPVKEQNIVHIFRGLPGTGKSYIANRISKSQENSIILSADDFFIGDDGVYHFDKDLIEDAHKENFDKFKEAIEKETPYIIVDNSNIKSFHYKHYVDYAQRHNYLVLITIIPHNNYSDRELEERNIHGVTRNTIRKMRETFECEFECSEWVSRLRALGNKR